MIAFAGIYVLKKCNFLAKNIYNLLRVLKIPLFKICRYKLALGLNKTYKNKTFSFVMPVNFLSVPAPDSFCPKKFFQICGLTQKSPQDIKKVFGILDNDASGYIEDEELK